MALKSFADACTDSDGVTGARHLLLGNGFSIACRPKSFTYGRLFDEADFTALSIDAATLFELSGTADFERAIEALRMSAAVLALFDASESELLTASGKTLRL